MGTHRCRSCHRFAHRTMDGHSCRNDWYARTCRTFNGFGGAASALVALSEVWRYMEDPSNVPTNQLEITVIMVAAGLSALVGWMTLTGSILAMFKLKGGVSIFGKWIKTPTWGPVWLNPLKVLMVIGVAVLIYLSIDHQPMRITSGESSVFRPAWYCHGPPNRGSRYACCRILLLELRKCLYRFHHRKLCAYRCRFLGGHI